MYPPLSHFALQSFVLFVSLFRFVSRSRVYKDVSIICVDQVECLPCLTPPFIGYATAADWMVADVVIPVILSVRLTWSDPSLSNVFFVLLKKRREFRNGKKRVLIVLKCSNLTWPGGSWQPRWAPPANWIKWAEKSNTEPKESETSLNCFFFLLLYLCQVLGFLVHVEDGHVVLLPERNRKCEARREWRLGTEDRYRLSLLFVSALSRDIDAFFGYCFPNENIPVWSRKYKTFVKKTNDLKVVHIFITDPDGNAFGECG